ncbi:carboxy-S-adenosyl-L-methionine synthase CmoA [Alteromonas sp. a30]|uniref:carboxy-S-adenosyl-L-methionine synthase CmoA n=1 Tax=Alteromonas sp. a30 TaxID=2730917 RepID=UPI00227F82BC|nr:carboxy-S-adenosyl-L-methionine synthase CmoA [Alteromonas sp. a30]MCY7296416.1 carboxy-S-adenosyl-L-methionine synthase CmoA [Alteromonas sp. a30]
MQKSHKDLIYSSPQENVPDFQFDHRVAEVFPDMIQRSIPGYNTIIDGIGYFSTKFVQPNSNVYDLGCSLGAASLAVRRYNQADNAHIIAIDNSHAMLERCALHLSAFKSNMAFTTRCQDILESEISHASLVIMNFTLQFIKPELRAQLINSIYQGLLPGGALILSEKLKHDTQTGNDLLVDIHHEFKRRNGYSELEISQKRTAIENVMIIDSYAEHENRLKQAGFNDVAMWFKCYNFASMIAIK